MCVAARNHSGSEAQMSMEWIVEGICTFHLYHKVYLNEVAGCSAYKGENVYHSDMVTSEHLIEFPYDIFTSVSPVWD